MQSTVIYCIVLFGLICSITADTQSPAEDTHPEEHKNKCWDEDTQTAYTIGTHNPKDSCTRIHCYPNKTIKKTPCGNHTPVTGYRVEQDLTLDYPQCCAKLVKIEKKPKHVVPLEPVLLKPNKYGKAKKAEPEAEAEAETEE